MKLSTKVTALAAATALTSGALSAQELQYSTHLPPVVGVNSAGIQPLFDMVTEATGGDVTVKYFWAGQLFDAAGNFEAIRDEVRVLTELKESSAQIELPPPDRGKIVGGVAFVVGLTFLSAAINALLALGMGASDDFGGSLLTVGLNGACAAAGIGYWYTRRNGGAAEQ